FSSRRRHTIFSRDWSSDVCSSDLVDVRSPGIRVDGIVPVAARVNADPDVEVRANALPHAGHQPDDVLAAALPVMFVGFNIQNDGLDARYRCRLHNQIDLPVDLDSAQHRSEEHTSELQSRENVVCRLLLEKKNYALPAHDV